MNDLVLCDPPPPPVPPVGEAVAAGVAPADLLWPRDTKTLPVYFLDGDPALQARVAACVESGWNRCGGLQFTFKGSPPDAPIRVTFREKGSLWSYIGTQALWITAPDPTINLGAIAEGSAITRGVLHEFGHAYGLGHEQNHPDSDIHWDLAKLYAYYAKEGMTPEEVQRRIMWVYEASSVATTPYDRHSLMHYAQDASLLLDPSKAVGWNFDLSDGDCATARALYGPPPPQPPEWRQYLPMIRGPL